MSVFFASEFIAPVADFSLTVSSNVAQHILI